MTTLQVIPVLCLFLEGLNEEKFWSLPYKLDQVQLKWNQTYEDDFTIKSAKYFYLWRLGSYFFLVWQISMAEATGLV